MPAVSKKQQRFFGYLLANPEERKKKGISKKDAKDFAHDVKEGKIAAALRKTIADMKAADRKAGLLPGGPDVVDLDVERARRRKKKDVKEESTFSKAMKTVFKKRKEERKAEKAQDAGARAKRVLARKEYASKVSGSTENVPDDIRDSYEATKSGEVLSAFKRDPKVRKRFEKSAKREKGPGTVKNRAADAMLQTAKDTAKRKGDTSKSDDRYAYEEVVVERLGGKGTSRKAGAAKIHPTSGDWPDSDRGSGNKAATRAGNPPEKKSPTYAAWVKNKRKG